MKEKVGVYICECGPNIGQAVDLDEVAAFAGRLQDVAVVKRIGLLCSNDGREGLEKDIRDLGLTRVVIAACSPKEHELTFRRILEKAGLNPFFLQIANIREQCAWITSDRALAAEKAKAAINGAVRRVLRHEPLEVKYVDCRPDVLVVGAGIAGISAALALAQKNRKVYLVEALPAIGGRAARYEDVYPSMECSTCMLDPIMDRVLHDENIEVLTYSEVEDVVGFYGSYTVTVRRKATFVDGASCIGCGACFECCPVNVPNEYNEGLDQRKAVYVPWTGCLPNTAVIDRANCLHLKGEKCGACVGACPMASIDLDQTDEVRDLSVGAIIMATGFDTFDPGKAPRYGYGQVKNVFTSLEFERILSSTGPTGGKILTKEGRSPKSVALVHCVGSRVRGFDEYCSGVCCGYMLKFAHMIRRKIEDVSVTEIYSDLCLPGKRTQALFNGLEEEGGIEFVRTKAPDSVDISADKDQIEITYTDTEDASQKISCDMVVLAPAMEGAASAGALAGILNLERDEGGFFAEEHAKLAPVATVTEGIFIAGCSQGPKDIEGSVAQGQAAAGLALSKLIPGEKLALEPAIAAVDEDLCSGCKTCVALCPYKAVTYDSEKKSAKVSDILCRGCGTCAAACPSGAIGAMHFTDAQVFEEIGGLLG